MSLQEVTSQSRLEASKKTGFTFKGKEIVLSKTRGRPMFEGKGIYGPSEAKRIEAATLYAATGSVIKVADISGISVYTVREWRKQDWFQKLLNEVRNENDEKIDAKFTEIVDKALDLIIDRLKDGDYVLTKEGDLVRKPVGVRDLALTAAINIDKRQLLRGLPTSRTESISNQQQLEKLAEQFKQLATKGRKPLEIQDVEFIEIKQNDAQSAGTETQEGSDKEGT